jgi:hypothetical protein
MCRYQTNRRIAIVLAGLALFGVRALAGCVRPAAYACSDDSQCVRGGQQGSCEAIGHCSFADTACESGRRFAELSGEHGGQCVGDQAIGTDAAPDSVTLPNEPPADAPGVPEDSPPVVCSSFTENGGRYYKKLPAAGWTNQRSACGMMPGNVFLSIPDDDAELAALIAIAGGELWIGISDAAAEGVYVTVQGGAATFLPWASGEPDNQGNQDCVRTKGAGIETATCGAPAVAVCECTP